MEAIGGSKTGDTLYEEVIDEAISLNDLSGTKVPNTITLRANVKKKVLSVLLDSGSTHNFLDIEIAKQIGYVIQDARPMRVTVANGSQILSRKICPSFKWQIQGVQFEDTVRLIGLEESDMILGETG